jgi:hypothetical protein
MYNQPNYYKELMRYKKSAKKTNTVEEYKRYFATSNSGIITEVAIAPDGTVLINWCGDNEDPGMVTMKEDTTN